MFYVIEHNIREDGIVNISETPKQTFASALSYYHERYSKMVMTTLYPSVALMLVDEKLNVKERAVVSTLWTPPVVEDEQTEDVAE